MSERPMPEERADDLLDAFEDAVRDRTEDHMIYRHRSNGPRNEARDALRQALLSAAAAKQRLRDLLRRALPSVHADMLMMDAIDRHKPLPAEDMQSVTTAADMLHALHEEIVAALTAERKE